MKHLISTLIIWVLMVCSLYSQQPASVNNKIDQQSRTRTHSPALKSASKQTSPAPVIKSYKTSNVVNPNGYLKTSDKVQDHKQTNLIQYNKTGDPIQDAANYQVAKQLYLDNHPELKRDKDQVQKISRSVYDNLPSSRREIIDANAARYQIVE